MSAEIPQIGGIILSARKSMGLTQAELSEKSSVPKQTISLVENNRRNPSYEVFWRLVHALEISSDLLVYPHRADYSAEQVQFIKEYLDLDVRWQRFLQIVLRALPYDVPEKQD